MNMRYGFIWFQGSVERNGRSLVKMVMNFECRTAGGTRPVVMQLVSFPSCVTHYFVN